MKYVNLGCGNRYHNDWINFDFISAGADVIPCDLTRGIPLEDNSTDVVYHSHVLEHFTKEGGEFFISECFRILKPGGIIRIAVPDLEGITKSYLECLADVRNKPDEKTKANYQWAVIELIDQLSRNQSGGEMIKMWKQENVVNTDFIQQRIGDEFVAFRNQLLQPGEKVIAKTAKNTSFTDKLKHKLILMLGGNNGMSESEKKQYQTGKFRTEGEVHLWMYDAYSLQNLLENIGFKQVQKTTADKSLISQWEKYNSLDIENGQTRKPDSLFMEAVKPLQ
ncbi:MAG: methyltransferase domain-containing protein [Flavobacteriales bacterium]|nr:methyltransferase domain-containing protein [Flavobacteriales bacterium]